MPLVLVVLVNNYLYSQEAMKQDSLTKEIFTPVDKTAEYPGGIVQFYKYVNENVKYPKSAKKNRIEGKVFIEFIINKDGSIEKESVRAITSAELENIGNVKDAIFDEDCQLEAVRIIKECSNWIPPMQNNQPVRQKYTLPINFRR